MSTWDELSNADYWSKRYLEKRNGWDNGQAHPFLPFIVSYLGLELKNKSVLVIGAGPGHDAEYLSGAAKTVTAVDLSVEAQKAFVAYYPDTSVNYVISDFLDAASSLGKFDVIFEHTLLCAIDPRRYPDYFQAVRRHLAPGGIFAGIIWNRSPVGMEGPPFSVPNQTVFSGLGADFKIHVEAPVTTTIPGRGATESFILAKRI